MTQTAIRTTTREKLSAWLAGDLSAEALWQWAQQEQVQLKEAQFAGADDLVRDIVDVLAGLPYDLILPEDGEVMLYGLTNPVEEADLGQNLLWNHLDGVDTESRRITLRDDPFYGPFCGQVM